MAVQALYQDGDAIYMEIFDTLHHIVNPDVLTAICGSNPVISHGLPCGIDFPIGVGSCLIRSADTEEIYLYTNGQKYYITSLDSVEHYQFNGQVLPVDPSDQILADNLITVTPSGANISDT